MTKQIRDARANEQYSLSVVAVTATANTLPTAVTAVTIADADAPTVVELLELVMSLKAQLDLISNA